MDTHKRNIVTGIETDHFIILDSDNLMSKNEIAKDYPIIQIVQTMNKNSYPDIKHIANLTRIASKSDEKEKHLFTIMLNRNLKFAGQQQDYSDRVRLTECQTINSNTQQFCLETLIIFFNTDF